jgi:hypothetical protein
MTTPRIEEMVEEYNKAIDQGFNVPSSWLKQALTEALQERDHIAEDRGRLFELEGLNNWFLYTMEFEPDILKEWEAMYEREKQKIKEALTTPLQDKK